MLDLNHLIIKICKKWNNNQEGVNVCFFSALYSAFDYEEKGIILIQCIKSIITSAKQASSDSIGKNITSFYGQTNISLSPCLNCFIWLVLFLKTYNVQNVYDLNDSLISQNAWEALSHCTNCLIYCFFTSTTFQTVSNWKKFSRLIGKYTLYVNMQYVVKMHHNQQITLLHVKADVHRANVCSLYLDQENPKTNKAPKLSHWLSSNVSGP